MRYASTLHEREIELYVGDIGDGMFVRCHQMSDVQKIKLYGTKSPVYMTGILVKKLNGSMTVEDPNRVKRNETCFVGKHGTVADQFTGLVKSRFNNTRYAMVKYYNEVCWEPESNIQKAAPVRSRRVPNRDLNWSDTRDRYRGDLEITADSIAIVSKVQQLYFSNGMVEDEINEDKLNVVERVLLKEHTDKLRLMRKLSSKEGADYEAFIVAKEVWDSMNEGEKVTKNIISSVTEMRRIALNDIDHTDLSTTHLPSDVLDMFMRCEDDKKEEFLVSIRSICDLALGGENDEAFVLARELYNSIPFKSNEGNNVELTTDETAFQMIKKKKKQWREEEDPQLHLMAKQFELNMMFEKLTSKRAGTIATLMLAGHMGDIEELFSRQPKEKTMTKYYKHQICKQRFCQTRSQCGQYCQKHTRKKMCAIKGCMKYVYRKPGSIHCSEHTQHAQCLLPDCNTRAHRSCHGYCWKHRDNQPIRHFCTMCKVIQVNRSGTRCVGCRNQCSICLKKSTAMKSGGICIQCGNIVDSAL